MRGNWTSCELFMLNWRRLLMFSVCFQYVLSFFSGRVGSVPNGPPLYISISIESSRAELNFYVCVMPWRGGIQPQIDPFETIAVCNCRRSSAAIFWQTAVRSKASASCRARVLFGWSSEFSASAASTSVAATIAVLWPVAPLLGQSKYAAWGERF